MNTSGERIRELRTKNRLTLDDVAKYLGVGRQAIYKYEQGTVTNIPLENLEKMAVLFGTTPEYLAGWTDVKTETIPAPVKLDPEIQIVSGMMETMSQEEKQQVIDLIRILMKKTK